MTELQVRMLVYIIARYDFYRIGLTLRDLVEGLGIGSPNLARDRVHSLRRQGYLIRAPFNQARSIVPNEKAREWFASGTIDVPVVNLCGCSGALWRSSTMLRRAARSCCDRMAKTTACWCSEPMNNPPFGTAEPLGDQE